jgi:hypothetical protein
MFIVILMKALNKIWDTYTLALHFVAHGVLYGAHLFSFYALLVVEGLLLADVVQSIVLAN